MQPSHFMTSSEAIKSCINTSKESIYIFDLKDDLLPLLANNINMLRNTDLEKILFLDIETCPSAGKFAEIPERLQRLWADKVKKTRARMPDRYSEDATLDEIYLQDSAIFAEFGKIVCISVGYIYTQAEESHFKLKSYYNDDEKILLEEFGQMLNYWDKPDRTLCGHNIKEFDIPYIARRMLINGIPLPKILNIAGKKPWEVQFIDTLELWKFGDFKSFTSLNLLTAIFDIPTPKDDIDGSMVGQVYYETGDLKRIATYCEKDVVATAQVFLKIKSHPLIAENNIEVSN